MRNISDNGLHFTAAWEGFRGTAYRATPAEKYLTIGYGHYGSDVKEGQKITEGQALILLNRDMAKAVKLVDTDANPALTQAEFDAVCDLVFNVGPGAIRVIENGVVTNKPTGTGQALRAGDVKTLRAKLALFINQNGKPLPGLRRRVAGRLALFDGKSWQEAEKIGRSVR